VKQKLLGKLELIIYPIRTVFLVDDPIPIVAKRYVLRRVNYFHINDISGAPATSFVPKKPSALILGHKVDIGTGLIAVRPHRLTKFKEYHKFFSSKVHLSLMLFLILLANET